MNANQRIVISRRIFRAMHVLLVGLLLLGITGCNLPTQGSPQGVSAPSGGEQPAYPKFWKGKGFRLEWDETPPYAGVRFSGFAYACSMDDTLKLVEVVISADVGEGVLVNMSNKASALAEAFLDVVPLVGTEVPAQPFVNNYMVDLALEGTATSKKTGCVCDFVNQNLTIVFKVDFQANLAWIQSATLANAGSMTCPPCGDRPGGTVTLPIASTFARELPVDLMPVSQSDCRTAKTEFPVP